jgi:hypothetical protein
MKFICWIAMLVTVVKVHAADMLKVLECHDRVVEQGIETLNFSKEASSLFGSTNVDHFIAQFGSKAPIWTSITYPFGRYRVEIRAPISIDYENCKLTGLTGAVVVQVNETIKVEISKSGIAGAELRGQWILNEYDWKRLIDSKGDWSSVGVPILTNSPVSGFAEYARQVRAPIRNRKEGFDNPIKELLDPLRNPNSTSSVSGEPKRDSRSGVWNALECQNQVVRHSVATLILPKEVESLFGGANVDHYISNFGSKRLPSVWNSVVYFSGRYQFLLQVPILIDYDKCELIGATNSAMVEISELTKVGFSKYGIPEVTVKGKWSLNENEWKWLVKNRGDWSVVRVPILTNAPVKGFDEYVRQVRKPIRER